MAKRSVGLAWLILAASVPASAQESPVARSVVKIFSTHRKPDLMRPWRKQDASESSGTGVVIEGRRILTNAHVVRYASRVLVQPDQSAEKLAATVEAIAPDIDLAVLKLNDATFFDKHPPMPRSTLLPKIRDAVLAYGYPEGGEALSITRGIVSRIEFEEYYYSTKGLRLQVDAAVNPGNSGGPALVDGRMIGIVFSKLEQADNIAYIIPNEEVSLFLADISDGAYDGKSKLREVLQHAQNDSLRAKLRLPKDVTGVVVWNPESKDPGYPLRRWDVITKIGDHPIDNVGMAQVGDELRLMFTYYIQSLARGAVVPVCVFRDGKSLAVDLPVPNRSIRKVLMPWLYDAYPSYMVWGPLVFSAATEDYMSTYDHYSYAEAWYPHFTSNQSPLTSRRPDKPRFEGEQLVVLTTMLPHRLVEGYDDPSASVVDEVDGAKVKNLKHLAALLRDAAGDQVVITFHDWKSDALVLDRRGVADAADEILGDNGIRKPYSDDLKAILDPKK